MEARQTQAVEVAAREGDGQGRAMAKRHGPWADLTVFQAKSRLTPGDEFPIPPPPPLLPQIAAQPTPDPGV